MTNFLDLDAVASEVDFTIKLNGAVHKLEVASIDTFLKNMKALEELGVQASPQKEMEVTMGIVLRAFPTLQEADLRSMKLTQLRAISDFARQANGEVTSAPADDQGADANPPSAS